MQASSIAGLTPTGPQPTTRRFADLKSEEFFALLIAQLQAQDPLNPTDNQQLLAQMSSIRQMEQSTTLNKTLTALAGEQRFGSTTRLIGHYVVGSVESNSGRPIEVRGVVTGVQFDRDGSAILELHNGAVLRAEDVTMVTLLENLPPEVLEQLRRELNTGQPPAPGTTPEPTPSTGAGRARHGDGEITDRTWPPPGRFGGSTLADVLAGLTPRRAGIGV